MLEAREITGDTVRALSDISVHDNQRELVADNAITIAQSHYDRLSWVRGLWIDTEPVGLIAMIDLRSDHPDREPGDPENVAYLWRLMIAGDHQGKGYGAQAMRIAFDQARLWGRDTFCVSVVEEPQDTRKGTRKEGVQSAQAFYQRFGLQPTEKISDGERLFIGPVTAN